MKIAVYPGSFDPLHVGHLAIMEYLTGEQAFDWVYLVISPQNPFKDPSKAANALKRLNDAIAAVKRHPELRVWVDDIELNIPPPNYTIKTLDALKEREPENDFTLIIGADNLAGLSRWRQVRKILSGYEVMVYPRRGFDSPKLLEELLQWCSEKHVHCKGVHLIDAPLVDISSSEIRNAEAKGLDVSEWLM
ncbi:MAG: nicotinate (nicotinamide) nucleotide adenylyltransferase [Candidatus Cryptobacteroides sp.]|jgi:nicotinate-nucleotide adenylyltransferase|nr:nicotinate (nicotinamide) nucleotide adenylyltransferase [Rikenellaceae bacterium]